GGAADRRNRQSRHRVPQRPAARTRPHGIPCVRNAPDYRGAPPAAGDHYVEQRKRPARRLLAALLFPLHPLPRPRNHARHRGGALSRPQAGRAAGRAGHLLRAARGAGAEEKAVHLGTARLAAPAAGRRRHGGANRRPCGRFGTDDGGRAAQERTRRAAAGTPGRHDPRQRPPLTAHAPAAMLTDFFYHLRAHKLPVSVKEYLTLLDALRHDIMAPTLDSFYYLARAALVKDESLYDRYDAAFGAYYRGIEAALPAGKDIPIDWLIKQFEKSLTPEEKAAIERHGWDKLMELFKQRLEEQQERHAGGNKWIGTGGTSPFGNGGYHPEGIRAGGASAGHRTAIKV